MGGGAFVSDGLVTPRMPPDVYKHVLQQVQGNLAPYYAEVSTPIEAPGKIDHGDIDILAEAKNGHLRPSAALIGETLGAKCWKSGGGSTTIFAIPWPDHVQENPVIKAEPSLYIQVDLHVCRDKADLRFQMFLQSHGDFWSIVGGMIRRFGLTCNPSGLFIRIAELEHFDKQKARIKILEKPEEILRYLELDENRFWQQMESWDELMDYAATCRFHDPARGGRNNAHMGEMTAEDRKRYPKRPMYRYWFDTYLPTHRHDTPGRSAQMTRDEVIGEAKDRFGAEFASRFDSRRSKHIRLMQQEQLWLDVRKSVTAEGSDLPFAMKGLKREITRHPGDETCMSTVQKAYTEGDFDLVRKWAEDNWEAVGLRQRRRDAEASALHLHSKRVREAKLGA